MDFSDTTEIDLREIAVSYVNQPIKPSDIAADSHVGLVRQCNEDSFAYCSSIFDPHSFVFVADGIGGHDCGDLASQTCTSLLVSSWRESNLGKNGNEESALRFLISQIQKANNTLFAMNRAYHIKSSMGTTCVAGIFLTNSIVLAHAGDSRCYRIRNGEIQQLTQDHSYVADLLRSRVISTEEAMYHPFGHIILRSIGPSVSVEPEINIFERCPGDRYLFCTDGVTNQVDDSELEAIIYEAESPKEAVDKILKNALRTGGDDNITLVVVFG